ncbi:MAG: M23 family metallopeptidase [Rhodospirillales bacterium]|nr:M23 family metallopeptidase [Rhodospirillales bacterium]
MNIGEALLRPVVGLGTTVWFVTVLAAFAGSTSKPVYSADVSWTNRIVSDYHSWIGVHGKRRDMIHQGIDIVGPSGQDIIAIADGWIAETHDERCMGPTVVIDHGRDKEGRRLIALYGHVQDILVEEGQRVSRGDIVARLGNNHHKYRCISGVRHLHLQLGQKRRFRKGTAWGTAYFLKDYSEAINPHLLWADGPNQITCFDKDRNYPPGTITYPVPC